MAGEGWSGVFTFSPVENQGHLELGVFLPQHQSDFENSPADCTVVKPSFLTTDLAKKNTDMLHIQMTFFSTPIRTRKLFYNIYYENMIKHLRNMQDMRMSLLWPPWSF